MKKLTNIGMAKLLIRANQRFESEIFKSGKEIVRLEQHIISCREEIEHNEELIETLKTSKVELINPAEKPSG